MRVYLPTTLEDLARDWPTGSIPVTDDLVAAEGEGEEEEYAALDTAADLSAALLAVRSPDGRGRRVVVVAEADDPDAPIPVRRVVAVHADESSDHGPDDTLGWYASQEVPYLLGAS